MQKLKNKIIANHVGANCVRQNSKGITLIALIITIIVMIILVGVTVNVALNGGLFETAQKAAEDTEYQADYETLQAGVVGAMASEEGITQQTLTANLPTEWNVGETEPYTVTSPNGNVFTVYTDGTIEYDNQEETEESEVEKVVTVEDEEYSYWKTDGQGTILYYEVPEGVEVPGTLVVPCQIGDEKITKIGDYALVGVRVERNDDGSIVLDDEGNPTLLDETDESGIPIPTGQTSEVKDIIISKGIESIGYGAFGFCTQMEYIKLPNTIQNIGEYTFANTSLKSITIPGSVTTIQRGIFGGCEVLGKVILEEGVTTIEGQAFWGITSIKEITIPSTVDNMGEHVFYDWNSDQTIYIKGKTEPPPETDDYSGVGWERSWDSTNANIVWDNE